MNPQAVITHARILWNKVLDGGSEPTDDEAAELIANLKFISVRDRLLADIPGIDDSMRDLLLGQWSVPGLVDMVGVCWGSLL